MLTVDLSGKKALVMGVTNQRSLGFAIAAKLKEAGAEVALSYQAERLRPEAEKLAEALGGALLFRADVTQDEELDALFAGVKEAFGGLDYLVHAIAFAPREAMEGRYIDTRRQDWLLALGSPPTPWWPWPEGRSPSSGKAGGSSPSPTTPAKRWCPSTTSWPSPRRPSGQRPLPGL